MEIRITPNANVITKAARLRISSYFVRRKGSTLRKSRNIRNEGGVSLGLAYSDASQISPCRLGIPDVDEFVDRGRLSGGHCIGNELPKQRLDAGKCWRELRVSFSCLNHRLRLLQRRRGHANSRGDLVASVTRTQSRYSTNRATPAGAEIVMSLNLVKNFAVTRANC